MLLKGVCLCILPTHCLLSVSHGTVLVCLTWFWPYLSHMVIPWSVSHGSALVWSISHGSGLFCLTWFCPGLSHMVLPWSGLSHIVLAWSGLSHMVLVWSILPGLSMVEEFALLLFLRICEAREVVHFISRVAVRHSLCMVALVTKK